jgi:thiamine pyrophosphokinase
VPGLKSKADVEFVREDGAHPEIRVDGKKLKADYGDFDSLKKTLLDTLSKAK